MCSIPHGSKRAKDSDTHIPARPSAQCLQQDSICEQTTLGAKRFASMADSSMLEAIRAPAMRVDSRAQTNDRGEDFPPPWFLRNGTMGFGIGDKWNVPRSVVYQRLAL